MARRFPPADRARFRHLSRRLDVLTVLSERYLPGCMHKRNIFMVDRSAHLVAVWTGAKSGTANTIRFAKRLGRRIHLRKGGKVRSCS